MTWRVFFCLDIILIVGPSWGRTGVLVVRSVDKGWHRLYWRSMKAFLVDTLATVVFFTVVAAIAELVVVGLEPSQVLVARLFMVPVMVATGRPYGMWRDWVFGRLRPQSRMAKVVVDTMSFISFQMPVYMVSLAIVGATAAEMLAAAAAAIVGMMLASRPFGIFLEMVRKRAGVSLGTLSEPR